MLADGYFRDPAATEAGFIGGWYNSGDRGALDADGYLYVTGRLKDIIRSAGETVSPTDVETALADCPGIAEVAVVGIPDVTWGEIVCAVVGRGTRRGADIGGVAGALRRAAHVLQAASPA